MKTLLTTLIILLSIQAIAQDTKSNSIFNQDEEAFLSAFVDPTFNDSGEQYGITLTKEMDWRYMDVSFSTYQNLTPPYYDFIWSGGLAFEKGRFTFHTGIRAGLEVREGNAFVIWGYQGRLLFRLSDRLYVGGKLWIDYRYSQDSDYYGNGDFFRENGAFIISYKLN